MPFWSKPTGREARACLDLEDPADPAAAPADPAAALEDPDTVRPRPASFTARPAASAPPGPYGRRCRGGCMPGCLLGAPGGAGAVVWLPALLTAVL